MKTTFACVCGAAFVIGCASVPPYPTDPNQQAAHHLATAQRSYAAVGVENLFAYHISNAADKPGGIDQIKALFAQNRQMADAYRSYVAKTCAEVDQPFKAVELRRTMIVVRRVLGDEPGNQLDVILERRVAEGNRTGSIAFMLDDDYKQFQSLNDPQQLARIVDRTIVALQASDSSRRPTAALFVYAAQVGADSSEGKRIGSMLATFSLRREELPDVARVYLAFAAEAEARFAKLARMPLVSVGDASWKRLGQQQRDRVEQVYRVETFDSSRFARVVNVQGLNESLAGTTGGAQLGSAIGQAQYIDRSTWRSYSATGQLAAGILGAVIGSMADRPPVASYRLVYTLRDGDGNVRTLEKLSSTPIYVAAGLCIDTNSFTPVRDDQCDAYPREIVELLAASLGPGAVSASPAPASAAVTPPATASSVPALISTPPLVSPSISLTKPAITSSGSGGGVPGTTPAPVGPISVPMTPVTTKARVDASADFGSTGTSKHMFSAERFAKANGCVSPVAAMNVQTVSYESFTVACANADPIQIRCEGSSCRELK